MMRRVKIMYKKQLNVSQSVCWLAIDSETYAAHLEGSLYTRELLSAASVLGRRLANDQTCNTLT